MIAISVIGVVAATGLLVVGLFRGAVALYYWSIAASVLAAGALIVGVRRHPAARVPDDADVPPAQPMSAGRASVPRQPGPGNPGTGAGDAGGGRPGQESGASPVVE